MKTIRVPGHYKIVGRKKIWVRGYAKRVRVYVPPKRRH